jgi:predicted peroxiredoxin
MGAAPASAHFRGPGRTGYGSGMPARTLVIKVTAGQEEPERCGQALTVAATALASGVAVSLWLSGEAAWFALPGRVDEVKLDHSPPFGDLLASVLEAGTVTLCAQCAVRRDIAPEDVIDGIRISGSATFVAEVTADATQALVY